MTKHTVHFYTWSEKEIPKGSNQVASAVHSMLRSAKYEGVEEARYIVIRMTLGWLQNEAPLQSPRFLSCFPSLVTVSCRLTVFGRIESDIRKREEILNPVAYNDIFAEHGTVLELGKHWDVYDWNSYTARKS